jgi:NADH-quinone oxidoreductase subunit I
MIRILREFGYTLISIAKGMSVTFRQILRPKQTVQYPTEELQLPPNYRGALNFEEDRCIVCELCEKVCPVPGSRTEWTIEMFWHIGENKKRALDEFYIDYSTCINCYLCVEVCPTDALTPGQSFELAEMDPLAAYDRSRLLFGKEQLRKMPRGKLLGSRERAYDHIQARPAAQPELDT